MTAIEQGSRGERSVSLGNPTYDAVRGVHAVPEVPRALDMPKVPLSSDVQGKGTSSDNSDDRTPDDTKPEKGSYKQFTDRFCEKIYEKKLNERIEEFQKTSFYSIVGVA